MDLSIAVPSLLELLHVAARALTSIRERQNIQCTKIHSFLQSFARA